MGKYAHFENLGKNDLYDLYIRHAEVARDIFEDSLRKATGNPDLEVELVEQSPIRGSIEVLEKMSEYDVVSVSSVPNEYSLLYKVNLDNKDNVDNARSFLKLHDDMPIYVILAGNDGDIGKTGQASLPRLADFMRNSLVVGEANVGEYGDYIEEHSSLINPTLASTTPFNQGVKYQFIDPSPSLEGHTGLIRKWLVDKEVKIRCQDQYYKDLYFKGSPVGHPAEGDGTKTGIDKFIEEQQGRMNFIARTGFYKFKDFVRDEIEKEGFPNTPEINEKIDAYMADPQSLHDEVMEELRRKYGDIDDEGYITGIDGTSFASPTIAGVAAAAAIEEQEVREEQGLPILNKDEITSLIKMATVDTIWRERRGGFDPVEDFKINEAGHIFTRTAGFGVFKPDMFRHLLDTAYEKIENDPDINRDSVELKKMTSVISHGQNTDFVASVGSLASNNDIVIDRVRFDFNFERLSNPHIRFAELKRNYLSETEGKIFLQGSDDGDKNYTKWARCEDMFGEVLKRGEMWKISVEGEYRTNRQSADITVYGYNAGGLMDQMMKESLNIAQYYVPEAGRPQEQPEPEQMQEDDTGSRMALTHQR